MFSYRGFHSFCWAWSECVHCVCVFSNFPSRSLSLCQTLLDLGASPDYKDSRGVSPLYHSSMVGGDPYCCELLLHDHAQVGCVDENGWQEIHQVNTHIQSATALPRHGHYCRLRLWNCEETFPMVLWGRKCRGRANEGEVQYSFPNLMGHKSTADLIRFYMEGTGVALQGWIKPCRPCHYINLKGLEHKNC